MLHVFVEPDNPGKDLAIECNLFPSASHMTFGPIGSAQSVLQAIPFNQQPRSTTKCEQFQMDNQVGTNERCSNPPNGVSNGDILRRGSQAGGDQYSPWHVGFPIFESGEVNPSNILRNRSASQSPHLHLPSDISHSSPDSQFTAEDVRSHNGSDSSLELLHPIPRQSPYTVTSYFASEKFPGTAPMFDIAGSLPQDHISESSTHLREPDWTNTDLVYPCLLQDAKASSTASAPRVTGAYTSKSTGSTYSSSLMPSWTSFKAQEPWDVQRHNPDQSEENVNWNATSVQANVNQQDGQFDQFSATSEDVNGLPWVGNMPPTYIRPSSLLEPYRSTCPSSRYSNGSSSTQLDGGSFHCFDDGLAFQTAPRSDDLTSPFLESYGWSSYQSSDANLSVPWTSDARNALLIEYKRRGLSYKDIKRIGGFKEAESTLRGRFRTLTKSKEQRVRKPQWQENDVSI
ncbi:hypothetical protein BJY01DRAFT_243767 [Aspergillus pseudoustus]|uniref:Myb-like domain-containing protein n=1 Tax=Aspergillus pseudoustus TaxID=1810923 RepID=A0ABR4KPN9_9EURO